MNCPICGEDPGFYIDGKPFCVLCTSQYTHANALGEGPNVSHRKRDFGYLAILAATLIIDAIAALIIWRLWRII